VGALPRALSLGAAMVACGALLSACGGGTRQDAGEAKRTYAMKVV